LLGFSEDDKQRRRQERVRDTITQIQSRGGIEAFVGEAQFTSANLLSFADSRFINASEQIDEVSRQLRISYGISKNLAHAVAWALRLKRAGDVTIPFFESIGVLRPTITGADGEPVVVPRTVRDVGRVGARGFVGKNRIPGARSQAVPITLHGQERVLSAKEADMMDNGMGGGITINIHLNGAQSDRGIMDLMTKQAIPIIERKMQDVLRRGSRFGQMEISDRVVKTVLR